MYKLSLPCSARASRLACNCLVLRVMACPCVHVMTCVPWFLLLCGGCVHNLFKHQNIGALAPHAGRRGTRDERGYGTQAHGTSSNMGVFRSFRSRASPARGRYGWVREVTAVPGGRGCLESLVAPAPRSLSRARACERERDRSCRREGAPRFASRRARGKARVQSLLLASAGSRPCECAIPRLPEYRFELVRVLVS